MTDPHSSELSLGQTRRATKFDATNPIFRQPTFSDATKASKIENVDSAYEVRHFLGTQETSCLKAWLKHFDKNQNGKIEYHEFTAAMNSLGFSGNVDEIWSCMDEDHSGELTFDEIGGEEAATWKAFRLWCGSRFTNPRDIIRQLKLASTRQLTVGSRGQGEDIILESEFVDGCAMMGWHLGFESLIFSALNVDNDGCLSTKDFKWIDAEVKRYRAKEDAKRRCTRMTLRRSRGKQASQAALNDFKMFLKKQFGSLFRAWRRALDSDGSMTVQRPELFKACRTINWRGDVRALWRALDFDSSGATTLEELCPLSARLLSLFKEWIVAQFGPKPAQAMWRAFDKNQRRKLSYSCFVQECESRGFSTKVRTLAAYFDWQDKKYLIEEDFSILDFWRPPEWLTAVPNFEALELFKKQLLAKYNHYLKAWRAAMDKDNSNSCSWHEFQEAAKHIKFSSDVAGAWMALDQDLSGYITLKEIDGESHAVLVEFKRWADNNFGGVRSCFKVMDSDKSNELNFREFRAACRNFGWKGNVRKLFFSFDQQGEGLLQMKEVAFLDDWEIPLDPNETEDAAVDVEEDRKDGPSGAGHQMLEYRSLVPGPGAYNVVTGFAAPQTAPTARHGGAYSFTLRNPWRSRKRQTTTVGPANYEPDLKTTTNRKPAWSFGSSATWRGKVTQSASPGPGAYEVQPSTQVGPKFSMRPRRGLFLHPSQKIAGTLERYVH
eukprot:TRINITY_DN24084_c0_g1_i1.p1 TRINITY_DN24084_c0_g1~~TRINITY_DN24084_c0_g1_i1.p1  ORF type:complete len:719 (+),score=107.52 TRINITY_DN24084_c0_g1_i1:103-2259(+)